MRPTVIMQVPLDLVGDPGPRAAAGVDPQELGAGSAAFMR